MQTIFDLEIHSKYARAVSKEMVPEKLAEWAAIKGMKVMATGDFTHPLWLKELKEKLEPAESGLFKLKKSSSARAGETRFLLSGEVSCIYSKAGAVRRVHHLIYVPSFEIADKINANLSLIGNLKSDGRPILGLDSKKLLKILLDSSSEAYLIPAHCLLPNELIHTRSNLLTSIKEIKEGDEVLTHKGRWQRVKKVLKRPFKGNVIKVRPYYFRQGLSTTPEHPFFAIKTKKNCHWSNGICKPSHKDSTDCLQKHFMRYKPTWISAKELAKGDVLVFPRFRNAFENHSVVNLEDYVTPGQILRRTSTYLVPQGSRGLPLKRKITVDRRFCRLMGYYLAEGYTNRKDAIGFTFHKEEKEYIDDVVSLMREVFDFSFQPKYRFLSGNGVEITFFSKVLEQIFSSFCYGSSTNKNAGTKALPMWMLGLSEELQVEILRGWWRGDKGYTSSRILMNQMKIVLLRLGIIPSIYEDSVEDHTKRGNHNLQNRIIKARYSSYLLTRLTFFEDRFRLLDEPEFRHFKTKSSVRHGWVDESYIYLPVRDVDTSRYKGEVYNLEVEEDNSYVAEFATVHNCWTPWFGIFGSKSGFNSLEECFEELTPQVFAVETGLSSDPSMNWRIPFLDDMAIVSGSDSHSLPRIGREATVLDIEELSYRSIFEAVKTQDPDKFKFTIEFFPEEGKYHYDGHRDDRHSQTPEETKKAGGKCAKCGKNVTIGVMARVNELASPDRPDGFKPSKQRPPFKNLIPLDQIIADALGVVGVSSKKVGEEYKNLIDKIGSEFKILLEAPRSDLEAATLPEIAEGITRVREGKVKIEPGYDGEYGRIKIFAEGERTKISKQTPLF